MKWGCVAGCLAWLALFGTDKAVAQNNNNLGWNRQVGGILVDAAGVVRQANADERLQAIKALRAAVGKPAGDCRGFVPLRKISLRGLQAALQQALAQKPVVLPDEVRYLGGLQRVEYVLVYPDQKDIVLAGPGEGWKIDENANVVGITSGLPVLQLDDLLVALRTVEAARTGGISVSIDPTAEGRANLDRYVRNLKRQRIPVSRESIAGLAEAVGPQEITVTGVPQDSHFAAVMVAADYRLKRIAMNLDRAPITDLPGFLDLLRAKNRLPGSPTPRWWLACHYEPLAHSPDRQVWQLRGQGVKAMTENEVVQNGQVQGTGKEDPIAKEFAARFTEKFEALAKKDTIFAEVRNLMDLCVVAAVIAKEDLTGLAGCDLALLTGARSPWTLESWSAPKHVSTQCSFVNIRGSYVITASGGVAIDSWEVARNRVAKTELKDAHGPAAPAGQTWWWN
jgi:hypothetical protein